MCGMQGEADKLFTDDGLTSVAERTGLSERRLRERALLGNNTVRMYQFSTLLDGVAMELVSLTCMRSIHHLS